MSKKKDKANKVKKTKYNEALDAEKYADGMESASVKWLRENVFTYLKKLNENKFLDAVRASIFSAVPIIIIGFIVILFWIDTSGAMKERLGRSFSATLGLLGLWIAFYLPFAYYRKSNLPYAIVSGIMSLGLFAFAFPVVVFAPRAIVDLMILLSKGGIILALFIAGVILIPDRLKDKNRIIFVAVKVSAFLIAAYLIYLAKVNGINLFLWIEIITKPLLSGADSLPAAMFLVFLMSLFWLAGIHGTGVVGGAVMPLYLMLFNANIAAYTAGEPLPYVITPPFFIMSMPGGTGATFPLLFYLLFSKSKHLKKIGKLSFLPGLVNINEPLLFGVPLMMNPLIAIPFVLTPVILAVINYIALYYNIIHRVFIFPIFTLPPPVYAYLATLDYKAAILSTVDIAIAFGIYYPFFKALEAAELDRENECKE